MFGRPPRDTGYESERSRNVSAAQRLHLLNSGMVHTKVESCPLVVEAGEAGMDTAKLIERIYLTALSRMPTDEEKERATKHAASSSVRQFAADMLWALINEPEFAFVH